MHVLCRGMPTTLLVLSFGPGFWWLFLTHSFFAMTLLCSDCPAAAQIITSYRASDCQVWHFLCDYTLHFGGKNSIWSCLRIPESEPVLMCFLFYFPDCWVLEEQMIHHSVIMFRHLVSVLLHTTSVSILSVVPLQSAQGCSKNCLTSGFLPFAFVHLHLP